MFRKFKSMKEKLEAAKELEEKSKQLALRYGAPRSIFYIAGTAVLGLAGIYFAASNWSLDKEIEKRIPKTEFVSAESYDSLKEKVNALSVEAKVREEESKELSAKAEEKRKDFEKKQKEAEEARANIEAQIKSIEALTQRRSVTEDVIYRISLTTMTRANHSISKQTDSASPRLCASLLSLFQIKSCVYRSADNVPNSTMLIFI